MPKKSRPSRSAKVSKPSPSSWDRKLLQAQVKMAREADSIPKVGPYLGKFLRSKWAPWAGAVALPALAGMIGDVAVGSVRGARNTFGDVDTDRYIEGQQKLFMAERADRIRRERIDRIAMQNEAMIRASDPQFAQQLLVGRTLPRNAVALGFQQRPELLSELARQLSEPSPRNQGTGGQVGGGDVATMLGGLQ